jgi:glycerol-3-phosphate cytidylyltransferase
MKNKTIITYGTFDTFHFGHWNLLKRASELGDKLIVGVSSDEFNSIKGKKCYHDYNTRKGIVESLRFVDETIKEESWEQKTFDIKQHDVAVFLIGDDWKGKFDFLQEFCEVIYLPRTHDISSTLMKSLIKDFE